MPERRKGCVIARAATSLPTGTLEGESEMDFEVEAP